MHFRWSRNCHLSGLHHYKLALPSSKRRAAPPFPARHPDCSGPDFYRLSVPRNASTPPLQTQSCGCPSVMSMVVSVIPFGMHSRIRSSAQAAIGHPTQTILHSHPQRQQDRRQQRESEQGLHRGAPEGGTNLNASERISQLWK